MSNFPLLFHNWFLVVPNILLHCWLQTFIRNPIPLLLKYHQRLILWNLNFYVHTALQKLSSLKSVTELKLNFIAPWLEKWILHRSLYRKKMVQLHQPFSKIMRIWKCAAYFKKRVIVRFVVIQLSWALLPALYQLNYVHSSRPRKSGKTSLITLIHNDFSLTKLQHHFLTLTAQ